ncbi:MAG TPA: RluA family pseudouridine synthase [Sandaracinaceae bacterium]
MGYQLDVGEDEDGSRLDVLLVRRVEGMSRAKARRMIASGSVRVNGRRARKGDRLASGDHVVLDELPTPADFPALAAPELPLTVRYEDAHLVIADKPAGLPSHPLRIDERETFAGALLARYPEMAGVGYARREPGILHRLDNDTSGLMLAARTAEAFEALRARLAAGAVEKRYRALVAGSSIAPGAIDAPIAPHPSDPRRVHVCLDPLDRRRAKARPARTEIVRVTRAGRFALLEVRASLAVRHQIRAHLAAMGHPLAGDWLYGGPSVDGLDRHFLHASRIAFEHPLEPATIDVSSPLPDDLAAIVRAVEAA